MDDHSTLPALSDAKTLPQKGEPDCGGGWSYPPSLAVVRFRAPHRAAPHGYAVEWDRLRRSESA